MSELRRSFAMRHTRHIRNSKYPNDGLKTYPQFLLDLSFRQRINAVIRNLSLRGPEKVLDCGCGDGIFDSVLKEKCEWIVGLDASIRNLKIAKGATKGNVSFVLGDAQNLPFKSGQFDRVLCTEVLEHLQNDAQALTEIHRVLTNNAFLVLTVPNQDYPFLWDPLNKILTNFLLICPIRRGIFGGMWFAHKRLYSKLELEKKLKVAAFELHDLEGLTHIFLPFHSLIWNLYASLNYVFLKYGLNALIPPKLFLLILGFMEKMNSCLREVKGSVNILVRAYPRVIPFKYVYKDETEALSRGLD